jgi:hypothetical protein
MLSCRKSFSWPFRYVYEPLGHATVPNFLPRWLRRSAKLPYYFGGFDWKRGVVRLLKEEMKEKLTVLGSAPYLLDTWRKEDVAGNWHEVPVEQVFRHDLPLVQWYQNTLSSKQNKLTWLSMGSLNKPLIEADGTFYLKELVYGCPEPLLGQLPQNGIIGYYVTTG